VPDEEISAADEQALADLRGSLLRRKRPELQPGQGDEAFDQHMLLAIAIHRVSRLYKPTSQSDTKNWIQYIADFFPPGRNTEPDAHALWTGWRCSLLKDQKPVVPITHGQSEAHWERDDAGRPCLNLEDAWADYEHSVERFIERLRADAGKRQAVLRRFRERAWTVKPFTLRDSLSSLSASYATSATVMSMDFSPQRKGGHVRKSV
jgi:hypothetical protein